MLHLAVTLDTSFWNKARTRLDRRTAYYKRELPKEMALSFMRFVADKISTQDFTVTYAPLSKRYVARKHHDDFWLYSQRVLMALLSTPPTVLGKGVDYTAYTINFSPDVQNVIKFMEYGTKNMPARPLFGPSMVEFREAFKKQTGTILKDLHRAWRG